MIQIPIWWISAELSHLYRRHNKRSSTVWYFAYGSNVLDANLCKRRIRVLESRRFILPNYRRVFHHPSPYRGVGFADVLPEDGCEVLGRLLRIPAADALWLHLDELVFPFSRYRIEQAISEEITFFFYRSNVSATDLLPSAQYLKDIVIGLEAIGFSEQQIHSLQATPTASLTQRSGDSRYFIQNLSHFPRWMQPIAARYEQLSLDLFKSVWYQSLFIHNIMPHIPVEANTPIEQAQLESNLGSAES